VGRAAQKEKPLVAGGEEEQEGERKIAQATRRISIQRRRNGPQERTKRNKKHAYPIKKNPQGKLGWTGSFAGGPRQDKLAPLRKSRAKNGMPDRESRNEEGER